MIPRNTRYAGADDAKCPRCARSVAAPGAPCLSCDGGKRALAVRLLSLLRPHLGSAALMMLLNLIGVLLSLAPPYITKHIVDDVILSPGKNALPALCALSALMAGASFLRLAAGYFGGLISSRVGALVVDDLRVKLFASIQKTQMAFFSGRASGEYTGRIMHDTEEVQRFLVDGSRDILVQMLTMAGISVLLFILDWRLALVVVVPSPVLVWIMVSFHRQMHDLFHEQGKQVARLNSSLSESIQGMRTVKAFRLEECRSRNFAQDSSRLAAARIDIASKFLAYTSKTSFVMDFAMALVWLLAGAMIAGGSSLTVGGLTAFVGYSAMFFGPVRWLSHIVSHFSGAFVSAERIFYIIDAPKEEDRCSSAPITAKGAISIRNLSFGYEEGKKVLDGLSLEIEPGTMLGLVGRSGVGKSTLVNLILRLYKAGAGEICLDGRPIEEYPLGAYRNLIGVVLQESFLFNSTIYGNILAARPDATEEEVYAAARRARAHGFISAKENGYGTVVGEGGALLSGGERQRIAIARAILLNPPILILDEATSSVDTETEMEIRESLADLCKGRTVIAIAHRLSTLKRADRLALIGDGRVLEEGSHEELLAKGGRYASLVRMQTELNSIRSDNWNP